MWWGQPVASVRLLGTFFPCFLYNEQLCIGNTCTVAIFPRMGPHHSWVLILPRFSMLGLAVLWEWSTKAVCICSHSGAQQIQKLATSVRTCPPIWVKLYRWYTEMKQVLIVDPRDHLFFGQAQWSTVSPANVCGTIHDRLQTNSKCWWWCMYIAVIVRAYCAKKWFFYCANAMWWSFLGDNLQHRLSGDMHKMEWSCV